MALWNPRVWDHVFRPKDPQSPSLSLLDPLDGTSMSLGLLNLSVSQLNNFPVPLEVSILGTAYCLLGIT